mmetsp:Transcript_54175/g.69618  ORF Transcript_54175/g.69618 Transcript_54175/m.69618 type:complete len:1738 (+) Transcript_54175:104-5317(+)
MVESTIGPALQLSMHSIESIIDKNDTKEPFKARIKNYGGCLCLFGCLIWIWWGLLNGDVAPNPPVYYENGMVYLNYDQDIQGDKICETETRVFIAIESSPEDVEARNSARSTWLKWVPPGTGANGQGEQLAQYVFFTTDTISTRVEAKQFDDMVLISEHGIPMEEWELVEDFEARRTSSHSRGQLKSDKTPVKSNTKRETTIVGPKTTTKSTTIVIPSKQKVSEVGKRHPKLCKEDMVKFCSNIEVGEGRMDDCMFENRRLLTKPCREDLAAFEGATRTAPRDWTVSGRRLLWWPTLFGENEQDSKETTASSSSSSTSSLFSTNLLHSSGDSGTSSSRRRSRHHHTKLEYETLPWCDDSTQTGCLMHTYSSSSPPLMTTSLPPFRFHSPAQISKLSTSAGTGGGGEHHDNKLYSPKLMTIFRFQMLEFLAEHRSFSFLLLLDITGNSGFLCLPSLVTELKTRPHERFLWRAKTCASSASSSTPPPRHDSFLLMSRDVVELVRSASRRSGSSMLIIDRLLFRLPLTVLSDEARLKRGSTVDWSTYQLHAVSRSSTPHVCKDLIWISGVPTETKATDSEANKKKDKGGWFGGQDESTSKQITVTMKTLYRAHDRFTLPAHWERPAESYPVVRPSECSDEPAVAKSPQFPSGVKTESTKSDRELVTAVRLGLSFSTAEKFLSDVRMSAALTAPKVKANFAKTEVLKKIPKYYGSSETETEQSVFEESQQPEEHTNSILRTKEKGVEINRIVSNVKEEVEEVEPKTLPRVSPDLLTRPNTDAKLKDFPNQRRELMGLRGSNDQDEDPLTKKTSLGVRPRLTAWEGSEFNAKRPVVDACSFDINCVLQKVIDEDLGEWWQEADIARQSCCCASRVSQAPMQCSAFKTRRFISPSDKIAKSSDTENAIDKFKMAANQWGPLSVLESVAPDSHSLDQSDDAANWTFSHELQWIAQFAQRKSELLEEDDDDDAAEANEGEDGESTAQPQEQSSDPEDKAEKTPSVFLDRGVTVLASFPGSGNTWVRLLLEYSTGYFTGSIYNDLALSPLLPGEGTMSSQVIAVKAHTGPGGYLAQIVHPSSNLTHPITGVRRVVLLVRHPLEAIWSEFQRRNAGSHVGTATILRAADFERFSGCMACRWIHYLLKHFELASELRISGDQAVRSGGKGVKVHVLRYERLKNKSTYLSELASVLSFLGVEVPSPERLGCAGFLARHSAVHRPKPTAFKLKDVYNAIPDLSCRLWGVLTQNHPAAALLLKLFGYESYSLKGSCEGVQGGPSCGNILEDAKQPMQTCAGRQTWGFSKEFDTTTPLFKPVLPSAGSLDDGYSVTAMNKGEGEEPPQPLDEATELAWSKAIEPLGLAVESGSDIRVDLEQKKEVIEEEQVQEEQVQEEDVKESPRGSSLAHNTLEAVHGPVETMGATTAKGGRQCPTSEGPLVSVLVSTTSRGVVKKGKTKELSKKELAARMKWVEDTTLALDLESLVLFSTMLPSLEATLECGFRYLVVVGFDIGDLYFDSPKTQQLVKAWIDKHVVAAARARNIDCSYSLLPVDNPLKKPGPVFNAMAASLGKEVEYIYRVNDDTEFVGAHWTSKFTQALATMGGPAFGVVGPSCPQGNRAILTHDFTHRAHIEIFGTYYPEVLTDWFMDDWISRVYGLKRTKLLKDVEVIHHSKTYGRRYDVDGTHRHLVDNLVHEGKLKIAAYMKDKGAPEETVKRFLADKFDHRQKQKEVDQSQIKSKSAAIRPKR